jgi:hypothetical protein
MCVRRRVHAELASGRVTFQPLIYSVVFMKKNKMLFSQMTFGAM